MLKQQLYTREQIEAFLKSLESQNISDLKIKDIQTLYREYFNLD